MNKILLCGNGINIEFNEDFCFKNFIDILTDEKKLLELINEVLEKQEYKEFEPFVTEFLEIFDRCRNSILILDEESKNNGVEGAVFAFKNSVRVLISQFSLDLSQEALKKFEHFFDLLFFYFLFKLEKKSKINLIKNSRWIINLKEFLKKYQLIYTLNYDSLLTTIYKEKFIWYVHGKLKVKNDILNYKGCIFESSLNPKWSILQKTSLPIFFKMNDLRNEFSLDIIGLNPKNDEEIFLFFIFSQVCNTITYYFYDEKTDLKNIRDLIELIRNGNINSQTINLINKEDFVMLDFNIKDLNKRIRIAEDKLKLEYTIEFQEWHSSWETQHKMKIILKPAIEFWNDVNKNKKEISIKDDVMNNKIEKVDL